MSVSRPLGTSVSASVRAATDAALVQGQGRAAYPGSDGRSDNPMTCHRPLRLLSHDFAKRSKSAPRRLRDAVKDSRPENGKRPLERLGCAMSVVTSLAPKLISVVVSNLASI